MTDWRRGGVIYQIYPRSFADSNDDGVGDLKGIASRMDYVRSLGVDAVWLSPFFRSPMRDFGYDVSDYCDVDPIFGSMRDLDNLLTTAHAAGLKVVIDQVYSHTSDRHPWFEESRSSREGAKAGWYHWADAKPDGGPPNNWLSVFGGPAWTWDSRRRQYYLHNFLSEQPDLNFHNPEVRAAILDVARFWLDKGVDGFRLDVANYYYCDAGLRDNPPKRAGTGFARPYQHQRHLFDRSRPETLKFIEELRRLVDSYQDRFTVAEISSDSPLQRSMEYAARGRLHTAYNFHFLEASHLTPALVRGAFEGWTDDEAWPSWSFSNHDFPRAPTRFKGRDASSAYARLLLGLLLALRGTIFVYQGEELGLPQADVSREHLRDPEGVRFWPHSLGRDGCRTPMPWRHNAAHAGFSMVEPWLPIDPRHRNLAVDMQEKDGQSSLNAARRFIAARRTHAALRTGTIEFCDAPPSVVAFRRREDRSRIFCAFNLGDQPATLQAPAAGRSIDYGLPCDRQGARAALPVYGGLMIEEDA